MRNTQLQISRITYNAAMQAFEGLVTVKDGSTARTYACSIDGPMSMSFDEASRGLGKQATRRHTMANTGLYSQIKRQKPLQRAGRRSAMAGGWLATLLRAVPSRQAQYGTR